MGGAGEAGALQTLQEDHEAEQEMKLLQMRMAEQRKLQALQSRIDFLERQLISAQVCNQLPAHSPLTSIFSASLPLLFCFSALLAALCSLLHCLCFSASDVLSTCPCLFSEFSFDDFPSCALLTHARKQDDERDTVFPVWLGL